MCLRQSHSQFLGVARRAGTTVDLKRCHGQDITSDEPRVPCCAGGYDISHGVSACAQDLNRRDRGGSSLAVSQVRAHQNAAAIGPGGAPQAQVARVRAAPIPVLALAQTPS